MSHPIELQAPDIAAYRHGNTGVDYVHRFDSGKPGPHVCVNAVMHGNEICGVIALDRFLKAQLRPERGVLTLCFVNVDAFLSFDPDDPGESRFIDEDMNRVWVEDRLDGDEQTAELRRARALRPIFDSVDYLLDIHSMSTLSEPILLCNGLASERELARNMCYPRTVACGSGHIVGKRLIEYTPFNDARNDKTALLIECGQHWTRDAGPAAIDTAHDGNAGGATNARCHARLHHQDRSLRVRAAFRRPRGVRRRGHVNRNRWRGRNSHAIPELCAGDAARGE